MLVYSAVCGHPFPILYKFDKSGQVKSLDLESLGVLVDDGGVDFEVSNKTKKSKSGKDSFKKALTHFRGASGRRMFVQMCILAGCDYAESVHGIGLVCVTPNFHSILIQYELTNTCPFR